MVVSGSGDAIRQNLYEGTNGPASPLQANDISLVSGANNNQVAPTLVSAALSGNTLTLQAYETATTPTLQTLEIYLSTSSRRSFLISQSVTLSNNPNSPTTVTATIPGLGNSDSIIATVTDPTNGTSPFSAATFTASPYAVINTNDVGSGSLRAAIVNANLSTGQTITFAIPGTAPFVINLSSGLPAIVVPTTIDGTTEAGVQINGQGQSFDGLTLGSGSSGSKITGLDIVNFNGAGIRVESSGDTIVNNLIGTDTTGKLAGPGNQVGIFIDGANSGTSATIGGTTSSSANTIGFNATAGVSIGGTGATGNLVIGNFIGVDSAGDKLGNGIGVSVGTSGNTIGGTTSNARNVIGSNFGAGISIAANNDLVLGNFIGTDANADNLGNAVGVSISGSSNTIGGTLAGASNTIGFNAQQGVSVLSGTLNFIRQNQFDGSNGTVTPVQANDISLSSDANNDQAAPTLVSAALIGNMLSLQVYEMAAPPTPQTLEIYTIGTPSTINERLYSISTSATLSTDPNNPTTVTVPNPGLALGQNIIATVTDPNNGTSPFSAITFIASPYVVINTNDAGSGSLRAAIVNANLSTGQTITFAIPSPSSFVINVMTALPTISKPTTIDGTSESTYLGGAAVAVEINGGGNPIDGLTLGAGSDGSTIIGLEIVNFGHSGILVQSVNDTIGGAPTAPSNNGIVQQLSSQANTISGNTADGILISSSSASGTNTIVGNLLIGNAQNGVEVDGDLTGDTTNYAVIQQNFIGLYSDGVSVTDPTGVPTGNGLSGILLDETKSPANTTRGTAVTVRGNVISSNGLSGVTAQSIVSAAYVGTSIIGNVIGLDKSGTSAVSPVTASQGNAQVLPLGNAQDGVLIDNVVGVTVGATVSGGAPPGTAENVISGNLGRGIEVRGNRIVQEAQPPVGRNVISGNYIGTDGTGKLGVNFPAGLDSGPVYTLGNLSDGIFLYSPAATQISNNLVSNNRAAGIHASTQSASSTVTGDLTIESNYIGTDVTGTTTTQTVPGASPVPLGNGSDGVFLDSIMSGATIGGTIAGANGTVALGNLISGNRANGVDLLNSSGVLLEGNLIGTNVTGDNSPGMPGQDFGNSSNGIFVNQSSNITIGGLFGATIGGTVGATIQASNLISGNHGSGIFISGSTLPSGNAHSNEITNNWIGVDRTGGADLNNIPNTDVGVLLSYASGVTMSGTSGATIISESNVVKGNVIAANLLDGVLLANVANYDVISNNKIGTDASGSIGRGNTADGVLLLGGPSGSINVGDLPQDASVYQISDNTITGNVISGNAENGVQIFGAGSTKNVVSDNYIGAGIDGKTAVFNGGNGVYLDNDGGGNTVGPGNLISGNKQSGVMIFGTVGDGGNDTVVGNFIGTDVTGTKASYPDPVVPSVQLPLGNGGNGVFIYGTSGNIIGGTGGNAVPANLNLETVQTSNLISGNAQAGVAIFSPAATDIAQKNVVAGNLIGTNAGGNGQLGNLSDGVDIYSGQNNTIGGVGAFNVISGNQANGVLIAKLSDVDATGNTLSENYIGINSSGNASIPNQQNGVLVENASSNTIGGTAAGTTAAPNVPTPSTVNNVISGNDLAGIQFIGDSPNNFVQGNYIGVNAIGTETSALGNSFAGVFINNLVPASSGETIGGAAAAGNIIAGSSLGYGVYIYGPAVGGVSANNLVRGNLIGIDLNNSPTAGNMIGVYIQNSAGNMIGTVGAGNVISANSQAGIELSGLYSVKNVIEGNDIGTDIGGTGRPGATDPTKDPTKPFQFYGVQIDTPSASSASGVGIGTLNNVIAYNTISGNMVGVNITGVGSNSSSSQGVPLGQNVILGNKIGTDGSGLAADPNFEYGVDIDNSASNTVGGVGANAANVISANGVDGIEIFGGLTQGKKTPPTDRNVIIGNIIGFDADGRATFTRGGGAAENVPDGPNVTLGQQLYGVVVIGSSDNIIGGKNQPNFISDNILVGVYITLKDFNGNQYATPNGNTLRSNVITNNGIYGVYRFESPNNLVAQRPQRFANKFGGNIINLADFIRGVTSNTRIKSPRSQYVHTLKVLAPRGAKRGAAGHAHKPLITVRPRVPALFLPGVKTIEIKHLAAGRRAVHHAHKAGR